MCRRNQHLVEKCTFSDANVSYGRLHVPETQAWIILLGSRGGNQSAHLSASLLRYSQKSDTNEKAKVLLLKS